MSSFTIFSRQESNNNGTLNVEARCAQEILDSLGDKRTSLVKIHDDCNTSCYNSSDCKHKLAFTQLASLETTVEVRDNLGLFFKFLADETSDRLALAKAKVRATATVGDVEMTVSEMENRRKLIPKYMGFLKKYIQTIGKA